MQPLAKSLHAILLSHMLLKRGARRVLYLSSPIQITPDGLWGPFFISIKRQGLGRHKTENGWMLASF